MSDDTARQEAERADEGLARLIFGDDRRWFDADTQAFDRLTAWRAAERVVAAGYTRAAQPVVVTADQVRSLERAFVDASLAKAPRGFPRLTAAESAVVVLAWLEAALDITVEVGRG